MPIPPRTDEEKIAFVTRLLTDAIAVTNKRWDDAMDGFEADWVDAEAQRAEPPCSGEGNKE